MYNLYGIICTNLINYKSNLSTIFIHLSIFTIDDDANIAIINMRTLYSVLYVFIHI